MAGRVLTSEPPSGSRQIRTCQGPSDDGDRLAAQLLHPRMTRLRPRVVWGFSFALALTNQMSPLVAGSLGDDEH